MDVWITCMAVTYTADEFCLMFVGTNVIEPCFVVQACCFLMFGFVGWNERTC